MSTATETGTLAAVESSESIPCEQHEDEGCERPAAFVGAHVACGWGLLFCAAHIAEWWTGLADYDFAGKEPTCKACGARVSRRADMEVRPL